MGPSFYLVVIGSREFDANGGHCGTNNRHVASAVLVDGTKDCFQSGSEGVWTHSTNVSGMEGQMLVKFNKSRNRSQVGIAGVQRVVRVIAYEYT